MRRRNETFADLLLKSPWWVSATLGVIVFVIFRCAPVFWPGHDTVSQMFARAVSHAAPFVLILFGVFAIGSFWFGKKRRGLVDRQTGLQSLREMPWKQFEFLVAEAFRRQGYRVDFFMGRGPDGGIDLVLRKDDRISLVQCKQWKVYSVGVRVIREMFGVMTAENADEAIIVTSGSFTAEAESFAADKPIRLIDGPQLWELVRSVQAQPVQTKS